MNSDKNLSNQELAAQDYRMPKMNEYKLADSIQNKFGNQPKILAVAGLEIKEKV